MQNSKYTFTFILVVCVVFLLALASAYLHFFSEGAYEVRRQVSCNPKTESCFVSDCEANDATCNPTKTYKKIFAPSKYAGSDYDSFVCEVGNSHCKIITCNQETLEDGEKCFQ